MLARIAAVAARNTVEVPVVIAYLLGGSPSKNAESVLADSQEYDVLLMHRSIVSHPDAKLPATADEAAKETNYSLNAGRAPSPPSWQAWYSPEKIG